MRWVRFKANDADCYGLLEGQIVRSIAGDPFGGFEFTGERCALDLLTLLPPVAPRTVYAAGLNYPRHAIALANGRGEMPKLPAAADIGYRGANALIGHGAPIVVPADAGKRIQYEAELVVVIGREAKSLSEADALSCVLGYTIGNDVSERDWQSGDRTLWRAKSTDTFMPMGPWIETDFDLSAATTTVRRNGRETLSFPTGDMIYGVAAFISRMSTYMTLSPGDVIWMGAEGTSENLEHGDVVEIEISGIGTLSNPIIRAGS